MAQRLERRFGWIEASLRFAGRFGVAEKKAYRDVFGLTESMISRDQDKFTSVLNERCGSTAVVKRRGRLEPATDQSLPETPCFSLPDMTRWLADVLGGRFEAVPPIRRAEPRYSILHAVVQAIGSRQPLCFFYCSRHGDEERRTVSPHAIIHIVGRLHLRAWDHMRNAPRDFVLTRMTGAVLMDGKAAYVGPKDDKEWAEYVTLEVRRREGESLGALRADFDLDEFGIALRQVRRAHSRYFVDVDEPKSGAVMRNPVTVRSYTQNEAVLSDPPRHVGKRD